MPLPIPQIFYINSATLPAFLTSVVAMAELSSKKELGLAEFVTLMASLTSLVALSIDAMLPALAQIGTELGATDPQQPHLIVSIFFLGMAFGQMFFGPFSDTKGRRAAILLGLIIFAVGTLICAVAHTMEVMLIGRIVQAFGVSGPRIAALAVVRDKYEGEAMARVMSFMMMVFILMPMVAPLIGQGIMAVGSWRHIFTFFLVTALVIGCWFFLRQTETLPKTKRQPFNWQSFIASSKYILTNPMVMGYTLGSGFIFGGFLAYISASQTIFQFIYKTGDMFPLYFALLAFAVGFASFVNGKLVMRFGMFRLSNLALVGFLVGGALLAFQAHHFDGVPPLWMFVTNMFIAFFCVGILFGNLSAIAMQPLGHMAGLGAAIINSLSGLISVPIAIFIGHFISQSVLPVGLGFVLSTLLAGLAIAYGNRRVSIHK